MSYVTFSRLVNGVRPILMFLTLGIVKRHGHYVRFSLELIRCNGKTNLIINLITNPIANPIANPITNTIANLITNSIANPITNSIANPIANPKINLGFESQVYFRICYRFQNRNLLYSQCH